MSQTPLLPLDFWRRTFGYNPWHFWGLADATVAPVSSKCNDVIREYAWMDTDALGRQEIRDAVQTAEQRLFDHLFFWPAPRYSEETLPWRKFFVPGEYRLYRGDAQGRFVGTRLSQGYVQNLGVEQLDLILAGAVVTFEDLDGDGIEETWEVTAPTTVTDSSEIAVYISTADRLDDDPFLSSRWRIEPVRVSISGGTVTVKGNRWLIVKPVLYEDRSNYPIDSTVDSNFVSTLDIYHRYTKTTGVDSTTDSQVSLIWESRPCRWGCCEGGLPSSSDPAAEGWVAGRGGIRNSELGEIRGAEAVYDATTGTWTHPDSCLSCCGEPDKILVRFLAGFPLHPATSWVHPTMATLVARLSAAEMTHRICGCDAANREWSHWQFDVSRVEGPETYQAGLEVLNNPLGTRRGHIYAWQQIQSLARVVGILV